jgi:predicted amidohydrolase
MLSEMETDLVVLPELCLSGYVFQKQEEVEKVSETIPDGFVFQEFRQLSTEKGFSSLWGGEKAENRYFNSAALYMQWQLLYFSQFRSFVWSAIFESRGYWCEGSPAKRIF